jgi:hypothetical protein
MRGATLVVTDAHGAPMAERIADGLSSSITKTVYSFPTAFTVGFRRFRRAPAAVGSVLLMDCSAAIRATTAGSPTNGHRMGCDLGRSSADACRCPSRARGDRRVGVP